MPTDVTYICDDTVVTTPAPSVSLHLGPVFAHQAMERLDEICQYMQYYQAICDEWLALPLSEKSELLGAFASKRKGGEGKSDAW